MTLILLLQISPNLHVAEWGSEGREFKSHRPDQIIKDLQQSQKLEKGKRVQKESIGCTTPNEF